MAPKYTGPNGHQTARHSLFVVPVPEPEYECFLAPVNVAVRRVARQFRMTSVDSDDLRSDLWVRLLADHGRALRRFGGRARIETYLTHVARNLWMDHLQRIHGKWRPSAGARRAGGVEILIERMVSRDGYSPDAALASLLVSRPDDAEMLRSRQLPVAGWHRRRFVHLDAASVLDTVAPSPLERMCAAERATDSTAIKLALAWVLQRLPARDRSFLVRRFVEGMTIADIAAADGRDAKPLYRYFARLLNRLRADLVLAGCSPSVIRSLLRDGTEDWDCGLARQRRIATAGSTKSA